MERETAALVAAAHISTGTGHGNVAIRPHLSAALIRRTVRDGSTNALAAGDLFR
jgi:hypothetical protein